MYFLRCLFQQKIVFFTFFLASLLYAGILIYSNNKIDCFILLNGIHTKWLDLFFINFTFLGDGIFSIVIALLLLCSWKLRRLSLLIIIAYLLSGIIAQVLKQIFNAPLPKEIIQSNSYSFFLDGVTGSGWDSFPSGHTTSVFALATILALYINERRWGLFFLIIAILVGYSRIYLGQHFLQNVIAGSILGTGIGVLVYSIANFRKSIFKSKTSSLVTTPHDNFYSTELAGK